MVLCEMGRVLSTVLDHFHHRGMSLFPYDIVWVDELCEFSDLTSLSHDPLSNFFRVIIHYSATRPDFPTDGFMTVSLGWTCITVSLHVCFISGHMEACALHYNLLQDS